MMKKGFLPIALLCSTLLLGGLAGCVNNNSGKKDDEQTDKSVYTVAISNRDALKAEWHVKDEDRKVEVALTKDGSPVNVPAALADGSLTVTSSDATKISVIGQKIKAVAAGKATITVSYQGLTDSVELEVLPVKTNKEKFGIAHEGTQADPLDNADAVKVALYQHENADDGATAEEFYIKGVVDTFYHNPGERDDGKVSWYLKKVGTEEKRFEVYLCEKENAVSLTDDDVWEGAEVLVKAKILYYAKGNQPETPAATFVEVTGGAAKPGARKTIENKTIAEILEIGKALGDGQSSWDLYRVTGYIIKKSGTNYFLADTADASDADEKALFELYKFSDETYDARMTKGAKIKFDANIKNYHGQVETGHKFANFEFLEDGEEAAIEVEGATALASLEAGTYKVGLLQSTLNENCFFKGTLNSSNYGETSSNWGDAADVVVEGNATDGFKLKVGEKYLNAKVNSSNKVILALEDTGVAYQWNSKANTLQITLTVGSAEAEPYYIGTYSTFNTLSVSKLSYLIKDDQIVKGQFALQFYAKADLVDTPTAIQINQKVSTVVGGAVQLFLTANPYNFDRSKVVWESSDTAIASVAGGKVTALAAGKATITAKVGTVQDTCEVTIKAVNSAEVENPTTGVEYLAGILKTNVEGTARFINGKISSNALSTVLDPTEAAKVMMVEATGGVKVKVTVGTTVKWLAASVRASGSKDYNDLSLKDNEADGSIFRIDENIGSLVINLTGHQKAADDTDYYIGTYAKSGALNSTNLGLSKLSYIWDSEKSEVKEGQYAIKMMTGSIAE